jgi:hypothetical protein
VRVYVKSAVDRPWNRGYLGYTLTRHKLPKLTLAKASLLCCIAVSVHAGIPAGLPLFRGVSPDILWC